MRFTGGRLTANERPGEHAPSWYSATAGPLPDHAPLCGEIRADVCVIGAGYAGLSTALHLAKRGVEVALLDANRIGWGASGRNGGQVGFGQRKGPEVYAAKTDKATAQRAWDLGNAANKLVRELVRDHDINCDLVANGYLDAAVRRSHAEAFRAYPEFLAREYDHDTARYVERDEMAEMLGTPVYFGGLFDSRGAHLHPLKYALGLGKAVTKLGVRVYERSRVISVVPSEAGRHASVRVETMQGTVRAYHAVLAMNGYIDGLYPPAARRIVPLNSFVAATEPLGAERARQLIRDNVAVCDSKFVLNYYRLTPDHRLLWGGGEGCRRRYPRDIASLVHRRMAGVFPQLADVPFTHAWGGTLAITAPRFPAFGHWKGGIWSISGWSGSGIHMATMGGKVAADAIAGERADWDMMASLPVPLFPGGDLLRGPLTAAALAWYGLRDLF